ncbi:DoxX-like protein [Limimaricola soesokkakensis]|uniref:DoxX-like protein n=1 Tax=Limimaricola soesokkakensis TaxID=1343159 RepID=A0A1X6Z3M7_9RHOB|nr:DoxX family protein [Limimaricola soesokkakensis]PSK81846.1 DoxX-like protein [Limimaricola soesokkakensis]SLN39794.1 hypothetical protein LOS8367_01608 [Limimaricola soesokkakensis]
MIVIIALLSAFFLFAGSIKLFGWQKFIFETRFAMFVKYGLNRRIMALVGLVELFGAVAIWDRSSWLGPLGALALLGTSLGAIVCHLVWDTWKEGVPAMVTATLSAILLWSGHGALLAAFGRTRAGATPT